MEKKSNKHKKDLLIRLRKVKRPVFKVVRKKLLLPRRRRIVVQVDKLFRLLSDGESAIIPGKVIGNSFRSTKVHVYAESFSSSAESIIIKNGGTVHRLNGLSIDELKKANTLRLIQ